MHVPKNASIKCQGILIDCIDTALWEKKLKALMFLFISKCNRHDTSTDGLLEGRSILQNARLS